ncbi:tetra-peptide repeat homeobox protein 1-like [Nilaparvata lugens]|uniref:tetra-peptide repeat homeobox protein 1-like n=1 Tax=Nilaparvata lugens TaxID=108931 RepID=UPI00193E669D|nr:tetra-peptide repeat homeobox protein 1-like [Nilaparvata lugens]XP_039293403.1 tetra-peptide repeat homeobox protein 1-like [Nilaparvata lugens]
MRPASGIATTLVSVTILLQITGITSSNKDKKRGASSFTHVYHGDTPSSPQRDYYHHRFIPTHVIPAKSAPRYFGSGYNTVTVTKEVPVPVPHPYPVTLEKHIAYPIRIAVPVPIDRPIPVHIPKPYPVHIDNPVPFPVKVPVKVPVAHPVPVPVPTPVAVPVYVKASPILSPHGHYNYGYEPYYDHFDHDPSYKRESGEKSKESENTSEIKG